MRQFESNLSSSLSLLVFFRDLFSSFFPYSLLFFPFIIKWYKKFQIIFKLNFFDCKKKDKTKKLYSFIHKNTTKIQKNFIFFTIILLDQILNKYKQIRGHSPTCTRHRRSLLFIFHYFPYLDIILLTLNNWFFCDR